MKYKSIYVAASSQHVGKTTTTLGLVSAFQKQGLKVGYSKPVGQNHIDVNGDKVEWQLSTTSGRINATTLISDSLNIYNNMMASGEWSKIDPKEAKIVTLWTQYTSNKNNNQDPRPSGKIQLTIALW